MVPNDEPGRMVSSLEDDLGVDIDDLPVSEVSLEDDEEGTVKEILAQINLDNLPPEMSIG